MKYIISLALAASAMAACTIPAAATPGPVCTTTVISIYEEADTQTDAGQYVDAKGHRWVGFKADGTPVSSTVATKSVETCTTYIPV